MIFKKKICYWNVQSVKNMARKENYKQDKNKQRDKSNDCGRSKGWMKKRMAACCLYLPHREWGVMCKCMCEETITALKTLQVKELQSIKA